MRRTAPLTVLICLPLLAACAGGVSDFDFDLRPNGISSRVGAETAPRPEPDANGLITYESYQVAVARRGDTVADVAARVGIGAEELARFNGRSASDPLRPDEVLALPRRVNPAESGTDIAAIAGAAIDAAEAQQGGGPSAAPAPAVQPGRGAARPPEAAVGGDPCSPRPPAASGARTR